MLSSSVTMTLGGQLCALAPSFDALKRIETTLETALVSIYVAHAMGRLRLDELAAIVSIGMNAHEDGSASPGGCEKRLFEIGVGSDAARRPIARYLLELGWSPEEASKKFAAEWPAPRAAKAPADAAATAA